MLLKKVEIGVVVEGGFCGVVAETAPGMRSSEVDRLSAAIAEVAGVGRMDSQRAGGCLLQNSDSGVPIESVPSAVVVDLLTLLSIPTSYSPGVPGANRR